MACFHMQILHRRPVQTFKIFFIRPDHLPGYISMENSQHSPSPLILYCAETCARAFTHVNCPSDKWCGRTYFKETWHAWFLSWLVKNGEVPSTPPWYKLHAKVLWFSKVMKHILTHSCGIMISAIQERGKRKEYFFLQLNFLARNGPKPFP